MNQSSNLIETFVVDGADDLSSEIELESRLTYEPVHMRVEVN